MSRITRVSLAALAMLAGTPVARAGGSPENILVIMNPGSAQSLYLGNYYKNARNIPDANVLYIDSFSAPNYQSFAGPNGQIDALFAKLRNSRIDQHIDYLVIADAASFFVPASGLVTDGCSPVNRFSITMAYGYAPLRARILAGNRPSTEGNGYFQNTYPPTARQYNARSWWFSGVPTSNFPPNPSAAGLTRSFLAAQLGYTGSNGNTVPEIIAMIDRSVAVDGTNPPGRFYFMATDDQFRNVRATFFPDAVNSFPAGRAVQQSIGAFPGVPQGVSDVLGVLTGASDPQVTPQFFPMNPGSYGDTLTSWSGTFDIGVQTKMSAFLRSGASGSHGTVEEPCNYNGKFPYPIILPYYFAGASLGEAYYRSLQFLPYQGLFQGDPMTRPFANLPSVNLVAPSGAQSGTIQLTATGTTTQPSASVSTFEYYANGVRFASLAAGQPWSLNTQVLPDGWNELRVVGLDSTFVRRAGRWVGSITVNNSGRSATLNIPTTSGDMTTAFTASLSAGGATVRELRLIQNERVIAATPLNTGSFTFYGRNIGAGVSRVQAEAVFLDGKVARSAPVTMNVAFSEGSVPSQQPQAITYTRRVPRGGATVLELPALFPDAFANATWTITTPPSQSTIGTVQKGAVVITAPLNASGSDSLRFQVTTPGGTSNIATVNLTYTPAVRGAVRWE